MRLVYALNELRVVSPCWSCEGHQVDGRLQRPLQVWFYSEFTAYPELIASHIARLRQEGRIRGTWSVSVSPHSDCDVTTFMIRAEPDSSPDDRENTRFMAQIRGEAGVIADSLRTGVRDLAKRGLEKSQAT